MCQSSCDSRQLEMCQCLVVRIQSSLVRFRLKKKKSTHESSTIQGKEWVTFLQIVRSGFHGFSKLVFSEAVGIRKTLRCFPCSADEALELRKVS